MKQTMTAKECRDQKKRLRDAEKALELGPVALSRAMNTNYDTYKNWRNGSRQMPGAACRCLDLLLARPKEAIRLSVKEQK
jgi:DNA-binding transcriptional regulator YiaG